MPKKISQINSMPQMGAAFSGWESRITLTRITQPIVNGLVTTTEEEITFKGVIQPLTGEKLSLKPEGLRSFKWLQIHSFSGENLQTNDVILYNGERFKVMETLDYSLNNYIEYHAVKDYE